MRSRIVKIGNSRGIRLPKPLLDQTGIIEEVELEVDKGRIIIRPLSNPRAGWDAAFKAMAEAGDDAMIDDADAISHSWDEEEWEWR
jgi:antitoxin MazE